MNTRKLMLLGTLGLMSSVASLNDLRAAPQRRRAENLVLLVAVVPAPQAPTNVDSQSPPSGMVVIPATGKSLKQPDVTLFRSAALLQKLGTLLERTP